MENFTAYNPVKLHFGSSVCDKLADLDDTYGKKALLIIGGGSVKQNGIFDQISGALKKAGIEWIEFGGIKPNPESGDALRAVHTGIEEKVDFVIGLGGGSVIDTAKMVALSIPGKHDPWKLMKGEEESTSALPIIAILTLAATGTEMNRFAVLQNSESGEKLGFGHPLIYPKESFLDPSFTLSVNIDYTSFGIVDLIAHALENYFGSGEASLADRYVLSIVADAIEFSKPLLNDLSNYELRARMMWAATNALNGYTSYGRSSGDFAVHALGHQISALFDTPHGATLSIVYPAWLMFLKNHVPEKIEHMGNVLFGTRGVDEAILALKNFFAEIGSPVSLSEIGLNREFCDRLLKEWIRLKAKGYVYPIGEEDYKELLNNMMN